MAKINRLKRLTLIILGGLLVLGLATCGLNKNSREWIEKNRVADMYKVYPTENPVDLFKVFPEGFEISQTYTTPEGVIYQLDLTGNSQTRVIEGELMREPYDEKKILSQAKVVDGKVQLSNPEAIKEWAYDGFLFQKMSLNQKILDDLTAKKFYFNSQSGIFYIKYDYDNKNIRELLKKEKSSIQKFEIRGSGKNYYGRTIILTFSDGSIFSEKISRAYDY